ncbi:MAG: hypothetical protein JWP12_1102 [Bacteroidetes bacterium]|nr:hypothetical protein [Bacteroidota bacterium]
MFSFVPYVVQHTQLTPGSRCHPELVEGRSSSLPVTNTVNPKKILFKHSK